MKLITAVAFATVLASTAYAQEVSTPSPQQLERLCDGCAYVRQIRTEERDGERSGVGVVGGAVLGGLLGNQVGGGSGKALATIGGAVAGGAVGNKVEKNAKKHNVWIVELVSRDGSQRTVELGDDPHLRPGDRVREQDGQLIRP